MTAASSYADKWGFLCRADAIPACKQSALPRNDGGDLHTDKSRSLGRAHAMRNSKRGALPRNDDGAFETSLTPELLSRRRRTSTAHLCTHPVQQAHQGLHFVHLHNSARSEKHSNAGAEANRKYEQRMPEYVRVVIHVGP